MDNYLFLPRVFAAAISDVAFAAAVGLGLAGDLLLASPDLALRLRLSTAMRLCVLALLLALALQAWLLTATMIGVSDAASVRLQFTSVMTGTHAGQVLLCELMLSTLLLALALVRPASHAPILRILSIGTLLALAVARAATGHAAADGNFSVAELVQLIHLLSTSIWAGCILAAGFILLPGMLKSADTKASVHFMRRVSGVVTFALLLIALSGIYNSYRGLGGHLAPLANMLWGRLLDLKVAIVGVAVALGAYNRTLLGFEGQHGLPEATRLARFVRLEAIAMLLILIVSAWLANSPPANSL